MPEQKKTSKKSTAKTAAKKPKATSSFTAEERAAMRERAKELKAEAKAVATKEEGNKAVLAKIATMPAADRDLGRRLHEIITTTAPELIPRLWYGMPAYAKDGKVLCFYQDAGKFGSRYGTLGFSDVANLDDGTMWPTGFAVTPKLTAADEKKIASLVKKAVR